MLAIREGALLLLLLLSAKGEDDARRLHTTRLVDTAAKEWNVGSALKKHRIHKHRTTIKEMLAKPGKSTEANSADYDFHSDPKGPDSPASTFTDCGNGPNMCTDQWKELPIEEKYSYLGQNWGKIPAGVTRSARCNEIIKFLRLTSNESHVNLFCSEIVPRIVHIVLTDRATRFFDWTCYMAVFAANRHLKPKEIKVHKSVRHPFHELIRDCMRRHSLPLLGTHPGWCRALRCLVGGDEEA
jgi:hypothetical protein